MQPSRYDYDFDPQGDSTAARVCELVGHDRRVLELGCAAGAMSAVLRKHYGCHVIGVEQDASAAEHARQYCDSVVHTDLDDDTWPQKLPAERIDTVLAADVLEHLRDPLRCLRQVRGLLNTGDRLVVSVPNIAHSGVIAALLSNDFPYADTGLLDRTHIYFFTSLTLGRMLHDAGFQVTHTETIDTGPHHPEFKTYWQNLPGKTQNWLASQPAGRAYQIIMQARATDEAEAYNDTMLPCALEWLQQNIADPDHAAQVAGHEHAIQQSNEALQRAGRRADHAEATLNAVMASRSWRYTAWLRGLGRLLGR